mgnify:CR=1 FL=1
MVLAYHVIFSTYGFWLPNDPRGSNSDFVGAKHLLKFGAATKVRDRRSHALDPHNRALRAAAKQSLTYPPVTFTEQQLQAVARRFARCLQRTNCVIVVCAILPQHTHMVVQRHRYEIEKLINLMKGDATRQLAS